MDKMMLNAYEINLVDIDKNAAGTAYYNPITNQIVFVENGAVYDELHADPSESEKILGVWADLLVRRGTDGTLDASDISLFLHAVAFRVDTWQGQGEETETLYAECSLYNGFKAGFTNG